tara:strand:+ start:143 stop:652 length:510 start_codon:yes stop_codon:yes gene_type:complete
MKLDHIKKERYRSTACDLRYLLHRESDEEIRADFAPGTKLLLGYAIPDFQRDSVWTNNQKIKFIESCFRGYDVGSFMISNWNMRNDLLLPYSECLIDGQQRFTALREYWSNEFKVFDYFWSELDKRDKTKMLSTQMPYSIIDSINPKILKETYNRLNFAGTNHDEYQRA